MELSSFVGQMFALKNELLYVLLKVIDVETYLSNMDQIFMILTLIKLGTEFDYIREQILTSSTILTFDDIFVRLLCHSSTATRSRPFEVSNETSVMLHLTLAVIPGVFVVATEAEANDLIIPTVIDRVTFKIDVISYVVVRVALLMSFSLLTCQLRTNLRLHLRE